MAKVKYNIKNVHYAKKTTTGYDTPVAIPGAVSLSADPQSENNIFWADGIQYYKTYSNNGYEGDLEVALLPDEFRMDILGDTMDTTSKVLIEHADAETVEFALGFEIETDGGGSILFWYYNCTASRPSVEANTTEETKEPETETLEWSCAPNADGIVRARTTEETPSATKESWFTTVYASANG